MIGGVLLWLWLEIRPQLRHEEGTLSNIVWTVMGAQYSWPWFVVMGLVTGLCLWLVGHFGWHLDRPWLLLFVVSSLAFALVAGVIARLVM